MEKYTDKDTYMNLLKAQIRCKKARNLASEEIDQHIDQQSAQYIEKYGLNPDAAIEKTLQKMGDPVEIGVQLDRVHRPKMDWQLFSGILFLCCMGIFIYYFMGRIVPQYAALFPQQVFYVFLGIVILCSICFIDYSLLGKYPMRIWWIYWSILAVFIFLFSSPVNGCYRFIIFPGGYGVVPLYVFYIFAVPLYASILYSRRGLGILGLLQSGICYIVPAVLSLLTLDFHTFLLFSIGCFSLVIFGICNDYFTETKTKKWILLGSIMVIAIFAVLFLLFYAPQFRYALKRISTIIDPASDSKGAGYVASIIQTALKNAPLWGSSTINTDSGSMLLSNGETIFNLIPEVEYNFLLTFVIVQYGILAGTFLISIILLLLIKVFLISLKQKNVLGRIASFGCAVVLTLQTLAYILPNLGVFLSTPRSLPFVSTGLSIMLCNMAVAGLLLSICRNDSIIKNLPMKNTAEWFHWDRETKQMTIRFGRH